MPLWKGHRIEPAAGDAGKERRGSRPGDHESSGPSGKISNRHGFPLIEMMLQVRQQAQLRLRFRHDPKEVSGEPPDGHAVRAVGAAPS